MISRVDDAVAMFEEGYNCAQAVFATYADLFGMDKETALKVSCSMGGGMGRMREVCGTVSGMSLLAGLKEGNIDPKDQEAKRANYELVRLMADKFKEENGSIVCRELLGLETREASAAPEERTKQYYQKRPCKELVEQAARIVEEILFIEQ